MRVAKIMSPAPDRVTQETPLDEAMERMERGGFRHLPVVDGDEVCGIVSDRDLLETTGWLPARVHATRGPQVSDALPKTVGEVMSLRIVNVSAEDVVEDACNSILQATIGCVPVVDAGKLVGIVTETDLLRAYSRGEWGLPPGASPEVEECMSALLDTGTWSTTVGEALELFIDRRIRHLPIVEGGVLLGMLSDRDVRRAIGRGAKETTPIDTYAARDVLTVTRVHTIREAAALMVEHKLGALPVVGEHGELVGLVTATDVLRHALDSTGHS